MVGFVSGTGGAAALMAEMTPRLAARGLSVALSVPDWEEPAAFAARCRARSVAVERTALLRQGGGSGRTYADALQFVATLARQRRARGAATGSPGWQRCAARGGGRTSTRWPPWSASWARSCPDAVGKAARAPPLPVPHAQRAPSEATTRLY
jgi:hypothetical protein